LNTIFRFKSVSCSADQTQLSAKKTEADDKILRAKQPKREAAMSGGAWQVAQGGAGDKSTDDGDFFT